MIRIHNLTYKYSPSEPPALKDLNLSIGPGEYVAIIGPNGCGKTTLIRHFNALLLPSMGGAIIDGLDISDVNNQREIRRRVGMIFQNPDNQIVGMSVEEDAAFGPGNLGLPAAEIRRRVDQSLAAVGLTGLEKRSPYTLSGGQKQLLAIAGLLAMDPQVIVLDEPTSSLDAAGKKTILALLHKLNQKGMTIIHVTQDMEEAARARRIMVMDQGRLAADGKPEEILTRVDWLKNLGLEPPRITELIGKLRAAGYDLPAGVFAVEDACREISALLRDLGSFNKENALRKAEPHA